MASFRNLVGSIRNGRGRWLLGAVLLIIASIWTVWLRPSSLGGNTDYVIVSGTSMQPTLEPGDFVVVRQQSRYQVGDVVAYRVPEGGVKGARVIHRIIGGDAEHGFILRGDNKPDTDLWHPKPDDIEGQQWLRVPWAGRLVTGARSPGVVAAAAGGIAFAYAFTFKPKSRPGGPQDDGDEMPAAQGSGGQPPPAAG